MRCRHFTLRLTAQYAQEDESKLNEFLRTVQVQSVQTSTATPGCWSILVFYEEPAQALTKDRTKGTATPAIAVPSPEVATLTAEQQRIYDRLREWRSERARAEGKPAYVIATNAVLMQIAREYMSINVAEDLAGISQFGPARAARYGPELLQLLYQISAQDETPLFEEEQ